MKRLTTDTPNGNFETILNFVHGKDGWAHVFNEDGKEVNLITWALNHCHDRGCDDFQCETLEEYDEALSSCMVDYMDCPIAMAYCFASQAVHLRSRLKMYEDIIFAEDGTELVSLDDLKKLVAQQDNDPLTLEELREIEGKPVPVWCDKENGYIFIATIKTEPYKQVWYFNYKGFCNTVLYFHAKFYRRKPEEGTI